MHQIVPRAPNVAGLLQQEMPQGETGPADCPAAPACPHTGRACPALSALFGSLAPGTDEARDWVRALAPCGSCRVAFENRRDQLRHVRLGQREREVLLGAASGGVFAVTEPGMTRSLSAARRRAALSLGKAGLVVPARAPGGGKGRAAVALTELGLYVMSAYGRYLTGGKPVRWTRPLRGVALPGRDPSDLKDEAMSRTQSALRETLDELKGVLVAAVARPIKDPRLLESLAGHLEKKASLLKAVLQPSPEQAARPHPETAPLPGARIA